MRPLWTHDAVMNTWDRLVLLCPLLWIFGFLGYPTMSPEWIVDALQPWVRSPPPSIHPHLSSVRLSSFKHTCKDDRDSANFIKRDFVMCLSPTASWPEWQKCEWEEKQEVCCVCRVQQLCWTAQMCPCSDINECSWWFHMDALVRKEKKLFPGSVAATKRRLNQSWTSPRDPIFIYGP